MRGCEKCGRALSQNTMVRSTKIFNNPKPDPFMHKAVKIFMPIRYICRFIVERKLGGKLTNFIKLI